MRDAAVAGGEPGRLRLWRTNPHGALHEDACNSTGGPGLGFCRLLVAGELAMAGTAWLACWGPAVKAAMVDPVTAWQHE